MYGTYLKPPTRVYLNRYKASSSLNISNFQGLLNLMSPALRREVAKLTDNSWIENVVFFNDQPLEFQARLKTG